MTGSGTALDPYVIWDVNDLQNMNLDLAAYYKLGQDIDASATTTWNPTTDRGAWQATTAYAVNDYVLQATLYYLCHTAHTSGASFSSTNWNRIYPTIPSYLGFKPISFFTGTLDGRRYTIDQLYIHKPIQNSYLGLFGYNSGVITSVGVTNCNITGASESGYTGGLVAVNYGGIIQYSFTTGALKGKYVGGFVQSNDNGGLIEECYSRATVTSVYGGGFIQAQFDVTSIVRNCYARGDTTGTTEAGGFIEHNYAGTIDNCYSTGVPSATDVGGFCEDNDDTITDCFWDTETSGEATSDGGTGKTTAQMKTKSTFKLAGWDFINIWTIRADINDSYPSFGKSRVGNLIVDQLVYQHTERMAR